MYVVTGSGHCINLIDRGVNNNGKRLVWSFKDFRHSDDGNPVAGDLSNAKEIIVLFARWPTFLSLHIRACQDPDLAPGRSRTQNLH